MRRILTTTAAMLCLAAPAMAEFHAGTPEICTGGDWMAKSDAQFAADCAGMAFAGPDSEENLRNRQKLAWMFFTRANRMVPDTAGVSANGMVPLWMTWPTDDETFRADPSFAFSGENRATIAAVTAKAIGAGNDFKGAVEEVVRNAVSYGYLTAATGSGNAHPLTTADNVKAFFAADQEVQMPIGSVEVKASWQAQCKREQTPEADNCWTDIPEGALSYSFKDGEYWFRGMHIMVKMRPAPLGRAQFVSEDPSWFWTTFEFANAANTGDPGVTHVREAFITQRAAVAPDEVTAILSAGDLQDAGYQPNYAPNGTQIRFTVDGDGTEGIHLGHTIMECFAGVETSENCPVGTDPTDWTAFNASCHSCHSGANVGPEVGENGTFCFFDFTNVVGVFGADTIPENYYAVDFMWPIPFNVYNVDDAPVPPNCPTQ